MSVQCQGSQAPIEALGNVVVLLTVFIVIESNYALFFYKVNRYVTGIWSMLDSTISLSPNRCSKYKRKCYWYWTVVLHYFLSIEPVHVLIQYLVTSVSIQQFYTLKYGIHAYDNYCNTSLYNIDILMALIGTTTMSLMIIPFIFITIRIMVPYRLDEIQVSDVKRVEHIDPHPFFIVESELPETIRNKFPENTPDKPDCSKDVETDQGGFFATVSRMIVWPFFNLFQPYSPDILVIKNVIRYASTAIVVVLGKEYASVLDDLSSKISTKYSKSANVVSDEDKKRCCPFKIKFPEVEFRGIIDYRVDSDKNTKKLNFLSEESKKRLSYYKISKNEEKEMSSMPLHLFLEYARHLTSYYAIEIILWSLVFDAYFKIDHSRAYGLHLYYGVVGVASLFDFLIFLQGGDFIIQLFIIILTFDKEGEARTFLYIALSAMLAETTVI